MLLNGLSYSGMSPIEKSRSTTYNTSSSLLTRPVNNTRIMTCITQSVDCVVDFVVPMPLLGCHSYTRKKEYETLKSYMYTGVAWERGYVLPLRHESTYLVRFCWLREGSPPRSCQTPVSSSPHWGTVSPSLRSDCVPQRATAVDSPSCGREWAGASEKQTTWTFVGKREKQILMSDTQRKHVSIQWRIVIEVSRTLARITDQ